MVTVGYLSIAAATVLFCALSLLHSRVRIQWLIAAVLLPALIAVFMLPLYIVFLMPILFAAILMPYVIRKRRHSLRPTLRDDNICRKKNLMVYDKNLYALIRENMRTLILFACAIFWLFLCLPRAPEAFLLRPIETRAPQMDAAKAFVGFTERPETVVFLLVLMIAALLGISILLWRTSRIKQKSAA